MFSKSILVYGTGMAQRHLVKKIHFENPPSTTLFVCRVTNIHRTRDSQNSSFDLFLKKKEFIL